MYRIWDKLLTERQTDRKTDWWTDRQKKNTFHKNFMLRMGLRSRTFRRTDKLHMGILLSKMHINNNALHTNGKLEMKKY